MVEAKKKVSLAFVFKIQANMDPKHRDRIASCVFVQVNTRKAENESRTYW